MRIFLCLALGDRYAFNLTFSFQLHCFPLTELQRREDIATVCPLFGVFSSLEERSLIGKQSATHWNFQSWIRGSHSCPGLDIHYSMPATLFIGEFCALVSYRLGPSFFITLYSRLQNTKNKWNSTFTRVENIVSAEVWIQEGVLISLFQARYVAVSFRVCEFRVMQGCARKKADSLKGQHQCGRCSELLWWREDLSLKMKLWPYQYSYLPAINYGHKLWVVTKRMR